MTTRATGTEVARVDGSTPHAVPRTVARVLDLLEIVLAERSCNLTTAAVASGLTPTTARRHLQALEARGYVARDATGQYSAGPTLQRIAAVVRDSGPLERLVAAAQPYLDRLAASTGESTYLAIGDGRVATYVATAPGHHAIRHVGWVGQNVTLADTAVGAALADPGSSSVRTGAVEADITAVSRSLPASSPVNAAVSIIGPDHRLSGRRRGRVQAALDAAVADLVRDLGYGAGEPAPASEAAEEVAS